MYAEPCWRREQPVALYLPQAVLEVARRFDRGGYIIRTISDGAGDDSHLSYAEMVAMVAHNSALCVEDLLRIMP